jgi:hypothetical protein
LAFSPFFNNFTPFLLALFLPPEWGEGNVEKFECILLNFLSLWGSFFLLNRQVNNLAVDPGEPHKGCPFGRSPSLFPLLFEIEVAMGAVKRNVQVEKVGVPREAFLATGTTHIINFHIFFSLKINIVFEAKFLSLGWNHGPRRIRPI